MEKWRLLDVETPNRAAMNLAIEEAIFLEKIRKKVPPVVRFWRNRSAVVIGYSQNVEAEVNVEACRDEGTDVVRRVSGGGAVYQDLGNLNYSIAIEADHPLVKGFAIAESYRILSSGVIEGVRKFGVELVFDPPSDFLVGNRKISGNAQARKKGVIFHHGTLLVNANLNLLNRLLDAPKKGLKNVKVTSKKRPVTNLVDEIGYQVGIESVKAALRRGFEESFSVKIISDMLSSEERKAAQNLYEKRYSKKKWNFRR